MGLLSWLFRRTIPTVEQPETPRKTDVIWLAGDGHFDFEISGESHCQRNLEAICGGRAEDGANVKCIAFLVPEPRNKADSNAVRVELMAESGGKPKPAGYLSRGDVSDYHEGMSELGLARRVACCRAVIVGGWDRGKRGRGHFGVKLDLAWPVERGDAPHGTPRREGGNVGRGDGDAA